MQTTLRIATRISPLALWQAEYVKAELGKIHPHLEVEIVAMATKGDKFLDAPLAKIGGKGLFVKELEAAMLEQRADIAVHSMKDVPMELPQGLALPIICAREDYRDAFVSNEFESLAKLPVGAIVGTSSLRRQCQIRAARPDIEVRNLRGNVNTRLSKLDNGDFDAIILAAAGLIRLHLEHRIKEFLSPEQSLPAVGQGAVGIECRSNDEQTLALLRPLNHPDTQVRVIAERAMNNRLQGGCQVPIAGFAELQADQIFLRGLVGYADGSKLFRAEICGPRQDAQALGIEVAEKLLDAGAGDALKILES